MAGEVGCIFTKALIPWVEREVGPEGVSAILKVARRSRDYLIAEYNTIPLALADELAHLAMELMGETDEDRWARRYAEDFMDWKPSRDERGWAGAYTMSLGSPRALYAKAALLSAFGNFWRQESLRLGRNRGTFRYVPLAGLRLPRWICTWSRVCFERYPTNWQLPRAVVLERQCAARGDPACVWDIQWKNPSRGPRFWIPTAIGAAAAAVEAVIGLGLPWEAVATLSVVGGTGVGYGLLKDHRHRKAQRLLQLQGEEILYSSQVLERKFGDLEDKVEQLSLLSDLSAAVNATLDVEVIYEQTLDRLVHRMGYPSAYLFLLDGAGQVLRGHRMAGLHGDFAGHEIRLDSEASGSARAAVTGQPVLVDDTESTNGPVLPLTGDALEVRSLVAVPLRVKARVFGVLTVGSRDVSRFGEGDVELLTAVANHVALAVDKAESFRTIEDLSRGLEERVRIRTEQLHAANDELAAAYRHLQQTQMQLVQREKMASVGQLVAGVAHELNNPIGFVYSNVATLEDFTGRLRAMLASYRARADVLPEPERAALETEWETRKIEYALKYLDSMIQGIREGAERARKIVRDLRVFARTDDDAWQPVDLHEEIESSLTLLNHLLKDRITVHRKFGEVPPVEAVRSQIDQVLLNLLANAAQAMAGTGELTIETRAEGDSASVIIRDTGPGIPAEVIGRIFDPFFTTKPVGEGTGLGLSISYEIVKKHGGEIQAESRPGEGASFTVRIPVRWQG